MENITKETRRQSYDGILPERGERCRIILETLGSRQMTVEEITDELVANGSIKYYDRNFVAPRLTELKQAGVVEVVGKRPSKRTGKNTAGLGCHKALTPERRKPWETIKSSLSAATHTRGSRT